MARFAFTSANTRAGSCRATWVASLNSRQRAGRRAVLCVLPPACTPLPSLPIGTSRHGPGVAARAVCSSASRHPLMNSTSSDIAGLLPLAFDLFDVLGGLCDEDVGHRLPLPCGRRLQPLVQRGRWLP